MTLIKQPANQDNSGISCKTPRWRRLKDELNNLNFQQYRNHIKNFSNTILIDVRTSAEYHQGHLDGAINMDYLEEDFLDRLDALDKNETYLIYCRSGRRSLRVCTWMVNGGFHRDKVFNLESGYQSRINKK